MGENNASVPEFARGKRVFYNNVYEGITVDANPTAYAQSMIHSSYLRGSY